MAEQIETLLHEEIAAELKILSEMTVGSDEYETAVTGITKLIDKAMDMEKFNVEHEDDNARKIESRIDNIFGKVMEVIKVGGPLAMFSWAFLTSLKFEEEGKLITTHAGRGLMSGITKFLFRK